MTLTSDQLSGFLAELTYKPGWLIRVIPGEYEGPWLCVQVELEDAYHPGTTTALDIDSPIPPMPDVDGFHRWVLWRLARIELHECREWLRLDGQPLSDPHTEYANFPPH